LKGVFLANHLSSTDTLTRTVKRQNTYRCKLNITPKSGNNSSKQTHETYAKTVERQNLV